MSTEKLRELSKPVGYYRLSEDGVSHYLSSPTEKFDDEVVPLYSQEYVSALLAELEREQEMRAQNLEIKTLLAEKVKTLETKLWDSQQLVDVKSHSQIELRSQISNLEERNRKDMSWRGKRICELDDLLEAANKRIAELEKHLATPVRLPRTLWYEHDDLAHEIPVLEKKKVVAEIRAAGFTVEGDD
ncbi:hypothetical protein SMQC17_11010 [Serratia marcescens]|nr:hypothetical protein SMQC17_11010 [Serratia marcescens]